MVEQLAGGEWKIQDGDYDNFEKYMAEVGVGWATRKAVGFLKPVVKISFDNGTWTVLTSTTFKNSTVTFTVDTDIVEKTADGRDVKSIYHIDGNKLVKTEKSEKTDVLSVITRELLDDSTMLLTLIAKKDGSGDDDYIVKCERKYTREKVN